MSLPSLKQPDLLAALQNALQRGVQLQWVLEQGEWAKMGLQTEVQALMAFQPECRASEPQLAVYCMIVDQQQVFSAPLPWGTQETQANSWQGLSLIKSPALLDQYQLDFMAQWAKAGKLQPEAPAIALQSDKPWLKAGDTTRLYWDCPPGSVAEIEPFIGKVAARGMQSLNIETDTAFRMKVRHQGKQYLRTCLVRVQTAPRILFEAERKICQKGENLRIWWHSDQALRLHISGMGSVPPVGQQVFCPETDLHLTLTAYGPRDIVRQHLHIKVLT